MFISLYIGTMVYAFYGYVLLAYELLTNRIVQSLNSNLLYIVDIIILYFSSILKSFEKILFCFSFGYFFIHDFILLKYNFIITLL